MTKRMFKVDVNPEIIKWARETAGWTIEEIANKLKISPEVCEKIEQGIVKPTCKQIEKFAYHYRLPVFAFFLPKLPTEEPNSVLFSLLPFSEESFSKELRFSIRKARYYQYIANKIIRDLGIKPDVNISKYEIKDDPVKAAKRERKSIKIKIEDQKNWWSDQYYAFNRWREIIEDKNILVFQFKIPVEEARGFCLMNQIPYVIALNSNDSVLERIFTLFHEYAHLLLGITEIYNDEKIQNKEIEEWCNSFAAEFLLPSKAFETDPDLQKIMELKIYDDELISKISKTYKVSKMLVIIRLKTLGIIDEKTCKEKLVELKTVLNNRKVKKEKFARNLIKECIKEKGREFLSLLLLYRSFKGDKRYIIENLYKRVF